MKQLSKLFLFVHPMPRQPNLRREYLAKWEELISAVGANQEHVVCMLSNSPKERMKDLVALSRTHFADRCIMDPCDDSPETKVLLAEDLERTFAQRGYFAEWVPLEIWTSCIARRWTEGLKNELNRMGYAYDPHTLEVVSCGQEWGGCLTKYSMLIAKHLGLATAPDLRADLSPNAGFPVKGSFVERIAMDRHVYLFLFETPNGWPMGQFMDGLRGVWEPPHVAKVQIDPDKVEVVTTSPCDSVKVDEAATVLSDGVLADVGDGCHPAFTTLIGIQMESRAFREALAAASIAPRQERRGVSYMLPHLVPMTTTRQPEA